MQRDKMTQKILDNIFESSGKLIEDFVEIIRGRKLSKHGEIRNLFKNEYDMKYGYANTLAHLVRDEIEGVSSGEELVDKMFKGKEHLQAIYQAIISEVEKFGKGLEIAPKKSYVSLRHKKQFALLQPSTKKRFDVGLILKGAEETERLENGTKWNGMCTHRVKLETVEQVDAELITWLQEAFTRAQ